MEFRVKDSKHGDLTGQRFGRWEVIRRGPERLITKNGNAGEFMYWCRCDCGTERYVRPVSLYSGDSKSCGCLRSEMKAGQHLYGKRFGNITVIERSETYKSYKYDKKGEPAADRRFLYKCLCHVCGNEFLAGIGKIHRGVSCGCVPQGARLPKGESGFNMLWNEYIRGATDREFVWELSRDEFRILVTKPCHYCGELPSSEKKNHGRATKWSGFTYNGLDRMNNAEGYTIENTVTCCSVCNFAKGKMSYQEFIEMALKIASLHGPIQIAIEA